MTTLTAAIVGTGEDPDPDRPWMAGIAYAHAQGYAQCDNVDLVACADVVPEHAEAFADTWELPEDGVYEDYEEMLREVEPAVVSICVPPALHADLTIGAARTGVPRAIHCEKPMAETWGGALRMSHECRRRGVQLTFGHQRRFGAPWRLAKERLDDGAIGELERIEMATPNLYDWGTHLIDLANYFNDERAADWVIGGLDYSEENLVFGAHNDDGALAQWAYGNGVHALAASGTCDGVVAEDEIGHRLVGGSGEIEVGLGDDVLRVRRDGQGWRTVDTGGEDLHGADEHAGTYGSVYFDRAIRDVVDAIREGGASTLDAGNALRATEIVFAAYESSRRRGRVDLPLDIDDNPLAAMVESGALDPAGSTD